MYVIYKTNDEVIHGRNILRFYIKEDVLTLILSFNNNDYNNSELTISPLKDAKLKVKIGVETPVKILDISPSYLKHSFV